ncbi:MAG: maleylpyruvate isomerase family mycothiol-dependent enzyme [Actinobacteria bacterium]|nr:maleylpyruvate isomerase family mycothiol-dependent enzyme [Actinomycetota bacterium]MBO0836399.1 maleylpyruvate isomerase family mycothiol-dependent enzyme [Actinomycetota bacterium]
MEIAAHIDSLERDGQLLAAAAERAGLGDPVPSCPGWQLRDLLRHQGYVHRWAARFVTERLPRPDTRMNEAEILTAEPPDSKLVAWFREGHAALVAALRAAPPDLDCWTFLPAPSPLAFWARRQAHETAMHRVDAELAAGGPVTAVAAEFAADGIDELIMGFFGRDERRLSDEQRAGGRQGMRVQTTDTGQQWQVELTEDGRRAASVQRGGTASTGVGSDGVVCTVDGPAAGLYLVLWNRAEPGPAAVTVSGNDMVLRAWRDGMRVTWQ